MRAPLVVVVLQRGRASLKRFIVCTIGEDRRLINRENLSNVS